MESVIYLGRAEICCRLGLTSTLKLNKPNCKVGGLTRQPLSFLLTCQGLVTFVLLCLPPSDAIDKKHS